MIDSSGDPISGRGAGCWRLMSIQARGCMLTAEHLRRDRRKEQQQQLASYMTEHDGDVVGFGDTRLGENAGIMDRLTKRAMTSAVRRGSDRGIRVRQWIVAANDNDEE